MIDNEMADYAEAMNRELKAQRDELLEACKGLVERGNGFDDGKAMTQIKAAIANVEKGQAGK